MSLIQEALRRQNEESDGQPPEKQRPKLREADETSSPASVPPLAEDQPPAQALKPPPVPAAKEKKPAPALAPPPLPKAAAGKPAAEEKKLSVEEGKPAIPLAAPQKTRAWPTLLGALLIVLLLIAGGIWVATYAFQQMSGPEEPPDAPPVPVDMPGDAPPPDVPPEPPSDVPTEPPPDVGPEPTPPSPEPAPATPEPASPAAPAPPAVTPSPFKPAVLPPPEPPQPPVDWPSLTLDGVLGKGRNGAAIINREVIGVGETVKGATLVSIGKQGVNLEYEGETQFLKVGNTID